MHILAMREEVEQDLRQSKQKWYIGLMALDQ